jgi:hypothetical protein
MRNIRICFLCPVQVGGTIQEGEMHEVCHTQRGINKCIQGFG